MDLFDLRKDFSLRSLDEKEVLSTPFDMLQQWIEEAIQAQALEPNAMALSTVSAEGQPSSRIVLLKQIRPEGLVFFTNYNSRKGQQIANNNKCAINFMWHEVERQVRIEGVIEKVTAQESDKYYNMRPYESKIGAWASPQSQVIADREFLDNAIEKYNNQFTAATISRPEHWGGYLVRPTLFEFWQGRKSRLHDRIQFRLDARRWIVERLAP